METVTENYMKMLKVFIIVVIGFGLIAISLSVCNFPETPAPDTSGGEIKAVLPQSVIGISEKDMRDYQTACISMNIEGIHMMKKSGRIIDLVGMPHVRVIDKKNIHHKVKVLEGKNKGLTGWIDFNNLFPRMSDFKIDSAPDTNEKK